MKDSKNKAVLALLAAVLCVGIAAFAILRNAGSSDGNVQGNVTEFAKSIDATKSNTPSVPKERLSLGVSGRQKRSGQ